MMTHLKYLVVVSSLLLAQDAADDDDEDEEEDSGSSVAAAAAATTTPPSSHPATKPPAVEVLTRHQSRFYPAGGSGLKFNSGRATPMPPSKVCKEPKNSHPAVAQEEATSQGAAFDGVDDNNDNSNGDNPFASDIEDDESVASDKSYYKGLCARLTAELVNRKTENKEFKQQIKALKKENKAMVMKQSSNTSDSNNKNARRMDHYTSSSFGAKYA